MTDQLPPSYWIDQIRADLRRRREAEDATTKPTETEPRETEETEDE